MEARTLVELVERRADGNGNWRISTDDLVRELDLDLATFYRRLYERREMLDTIAPDEFGPENVFALVAAVCPDIEACETELGRRGILLSVDERTELADRFVSAVGRDASTHRIDTDAFEAMRRRYGDGRDAIVCYLDHYFDLDSYIEPVVEEFLLAHPEMIARVARRRARDAIDLLFQRHILSRDTLLDSVVSRLLRELPNAKPVAPAGYDPELQRALDDLGLGQLPSTLDELKRIYRTLMKTYHPDVNPTGLKLSQRITRAYALASAAMQGGDW